jgi:hypothetical protein
MREYYIHLVMETICAYERVSSESSPEMYSQDSSASMSFEGRSSKMITERV